MHWWNWMCSVCSCTPIFVSFIRKGSSFDLKKLKFYTNLHCQCLKASTALIFKPFQLFLASLFTQPFLDVLAFRHTHVCLYLSFQASAESWYKRCQIKEPSIFVVFWQWWNKGYIPPISCLRRPLFWPFIEREPSHDLYGMALFPFFTDKAGMISHSYKLFVNCPTIFKTFSLLTISIS